MTDEGFKIISELNTIIQKKLPLQNLLVEIKQLETHIDSAKLPPRDLIRIQAAFSLAQQSAQLWGPIGEGGEGYCQDVFNPDWGQVLDADWCGLLATWSLGGAVFFSILDLMFQALQDAYWVLIG